MVRPSTWRPRLSGLVKRSFSLAGHRTSVALEQEFWTAVLRVARARGQSLSALVAAVDATREPDRPLASALRVMALLESPSLASQSVPESHSLSEIQSLPESQSSGVDTEGGQA
jgi:predicted DNA-binding ribbon-helix-helix protein